MNMTASLDRPVSLAPTPKRHTARRAVLVGLSAAGLMGGMTGLAGVAQAASGDTSTQALVANVQVGSAITLTNLTPGFTLIGNPGQTVDTSTATGIDNPQNYTVTTNNNAGYTVTVLSRTATMVAQRAGNTDSIPIGDLNVTDNTGAYTPLIAGTPVLIHTQAVRSATGGDNLSSDYQITIPFVQDDTYSATLDYVATAL